MIGQLRGTVALIAQNTAIIDVNGVGYEISATSRLLSRLEINQPTTLSIETLVAETFIRLVGFETEAERQSFRLLQTVQGVGAKAALAILQALPPAEIIDAIIIGDKAAIARAQGVGPKLAARVVTELKGKTGNIFGVTEFAPNTTSVAALATDVMASSARRDTILALINLGYDDAKARSALAAIPVTEHENTSALITAALKGLSAP